MYYCIVCDCLIINNNIPVNIFFVNIFGMETHTRKTQNRNSEINLHKIASYTIDIQKCHVYY